MNIFIRTTLITGATLMSVLTQAQVRNAADDSLPERIAGSTSVSAQCQNLKAQATPLTDARGGFAMAPATVMKESGIITEMPSGHVYENMYNSSKGFWVFLDMLTNSETDGAAVDMVVDGKNIYISNPIAFWESPDVWVKGTLENGVARFNRQPYCVAYDSEGNEGILYVQRLRKEVSGEVSTYVPDEEEAEFTWDGSVLAQKDTTEEYVLGLTDEDGNWVGYGTYCIVNEVTSYTTPVIPDDISEVAEEYTLRYALKDSVWNASKIMVAVYDTEVYIGNLNPYAPDQWVKGEKENGKVVIPAAEYLGVDPYINHHNFCFAGGKELVWNDYYESYREENVLLHDTPVTFTLNEDGHLMESDNMLMITGSDRSVITYGVYNTPVIKLFERTYPVIPDSPVVTDGATDEWGAIFAVYMPNYDIHGNYIDPAELYFTVYTDNEESPVVWSPDDFFSLEEPSIYLHYGIYDGYVYSNGAYHEISLPQLYDRYGFQLVSITDDEINGKSSITWVSDPDSVNIGELPAAPENIISTEYFDMTGKRVDPDCYKGFVIKRDILESGRPSAVSKTILR